MSDQPTVQTASGTVRGRTRDGVATYLGIPYAAPPVGDLRFAEPAPAPPWPGVREASEPGPTAPQNAMKSFFGMDMFAITGSQWRRGDDYLTLNIWAPATGTGHPVMVYIHGGGLVAGTKDAPVYDGRNFARDGAVAVTINYRLGVEGFLAIPGAPTNLGLRDMLAGMRWVQGNIEAFGGDPANVTVFGESGGAMATACLVTSPLSTGLFRRAIIESGHGSAVYPKHIAHRATRKMAELLKITPDLNGFRSIDSETALQALQQVSKAGTVDMKDKNGFDPSFGQGVINPIVGDDVLPRHPLIALGDGAGREVDLLIGTNEDEFNFWLAPTRLVLTPRFLARFMLSRLGGDVDGILAAYRQQNRRARGGQIVSRIMSDLAFRWPTRQYAAAHQGRTFSYEFDWDSPASGGRLGAAHGLELPFVFDTLATVSGPRGWLGENPPQHLADRVHGAWLQFATDGTAPWPEFDRTTRIVQRLTRDVSTSEDPLPPSAFIPTPAPDIENESV